MESNCVHSFSSSASSVFPLVLFSISRCEGPCNVSTSSSSANLAGIRTQRSTRPYSTHRSQLLVSLSGHSGYSGSQRHRCSAIRSSYTRPVPRGGGPASGSGRPDGENPPPSVSGTKKSSVSPSLEAIFFTMASLVRRL
uniref:Putative histone deacetylase hdac6 protein n=1 Tax=Ixodes ricinus TaxID=34613 RepID=A0A0K8RIN8_IXORI